jgi:hypothetical protein
MTNNTGAAANRYLLPQNSISNLPESTRKERAIYQARKERAIYNDA